MRRTPFLISALLAVGGFAIQVPYGVLIAHGDFPLSNLAQIIALVGRFFLNWIVLSIFTPSLTVVALANLAINALDLAVGVAFVKWKHPNVTFVSAKPGPIFGSGIFSFSVYVLILLAGGKLTYSLDSIIISRALGDHEVLAFENGRCSSSI
jgi:O-antigen/teichoic acid export membrane protein